MITCISRKNYYGTKEQAEQALLQARAKYSSSENTGPVAVYRCEHCGGYHLTSKGEASNVLHSKENQRQITLQREADYWESKLK